jgi:hypothetical protein
VTDAKLVIDERFRGPNDSGNGGYSCGLVGVPAGNPAEVRLRRPPPLSRPLTIERDDGVVRLMDGADVVAEARPVDAVDVTVPVPVSFADAEASAAPLPEHFFPECFVCGPDRRPGDGLRIFAAEVSGRDGICAATWVPDVSLADHDGVHVADEFVWAALDCPTSPPVIPLLPPDRVVVLGTLAVERRERLRIGERYILMSWLESKGDKVCIGDAAVLNEDGEVLAVSRGKWVLVDPERFGSGTSEKRGG